MVGLDEMPLEILEEILNQAVTPRFKYELARIASVSPIWQGIIEKQTFAELRLYSWNIREAMRILRNRPVRFNAVQRIQFGIPGSTASKGPMGRRTHRVRGLDMRKVYYEISIKTLLICLNEWPHTGRSLEICLYTCISCFTYDPIFDSFPDPYWTPSKVSAVTKLTVRDLWGASGGAIRVWKHLHAFPGLQVLDVEYASTQPDKLNECLYRQKTFSGLAKALKKMPSALEAMTLIFDYHYGKTGTIWNDTKRLVAGFRNITQNMAHVEVCGIAAAPQLFWPEQVDVANPAPVWLKLKQMALDCRIAAGDDKKKEKEEVLNSKDIDSLNELFSAVGKAVANMPRLEFLRIWTAGRTNRDHGFELHIKGRTCSVTWTGRPPFQPDEDVKKVWRIMARERPLDLSMNWEHN